MSDIFHAHFSLDQIQQVFHVMNVATQHQFQVLTKRPERALRFADKLEWTENIWMGTSIEDMRVAKRADALRKIPAAVRFISAEPLLNSLAALDLGDMHWVIGGGESGHGFRPCQVVWAQSSAIDAGRLVSPSSGSSGADARPKSGGRLLDDREWNGYPVELATTS